MNQVDGMPPGASQPRREPRDGAAATAAQPSWFAILAVMTALVGFVLWLLGAFEQVPAPRDPSRPAVVFDEELASWRTPPTGEAAGSIEWRGRPPAGGAVRITIEIDGEVQPAQEFAGDSPESQSGRWRVARVDWPRGFEFELSLVDADGHVLRRSARRTVTWPD